MADQVRVNGNVYSWGSVVININDGRFYGITSLTYADKRERATQYGQGRAQAPRGKTTGKYSTENPKIKMAKDSAEAFREYLASQSSSGTSYGNTSFQIVATYAEDGLPGSTVEINACNYVGTTETNEEGMEGIIEEIEVHCLAIYRNGLALFDDSEGQV